MKVKTVFLLQDTKDSLDELKTKFSTDDEYLVAGDSLDGESALPQILDTCPDYLIVSLILPGSDGLQVIKKIRENNKTIKIVAISALIRDEIINMAFSFGADYFMAKPCKFEALKQVLILLAEKNTAEKLITEVKAPMVPSIDEKISKIFISVGIPPHIKGYNFLREGVKLAMQFPEVINNITKMLYPRISAKYDTSPSKVERAIRHAIEVAWSRGRIENINNILGVQAYVNSQKPTNGEFIALLADKMALEHGIHVE